MDTNPDMFTEAKIIIEFNTDGTWNVVYDTGVGGERFRNIKDIDCLLDLVREYLRDKVS